MQRFFAALLVVSAVFGIGTVAYAHGQVPDARGYTATPVEASACLHVARAYDDACYAALLEQVKEAVQKRQFQVAAQRLTHMLSIHEVAGVYTDRALMYAELGRFDDALEDTEKAIKIDRAYLSAHAIRTKMLVYIGRFREALASVEQWITHAPQDTHAWMIRTFVNRNLGNEHKVSARVFPTVSAFSR